ncbi:MAG: hypothetical protein KDD43_16575, partial [Bdellovibrionales bacterium]|nr:hypothetical protein [Bdellovibrionales bacterium]
DQIARAAEQVTETKYAKYLEVKATYDGLLAQAQADGRQQGESQGHAEGLRQGDIDGKASGTSQGSLDGEREGLLAGFNRGKVTGEAKGKDDGYQHGLNLPENYQQGFDLGAEQGKKDAYAEAHLVDFPKGRKAKRDELMATLPSQMIELDNTTGLPLFVPHNVLPLARMNRQPAMMLNEVAPAFMSMATNENIEMMTVNLDTDARLLVPIHAAALQPNCQQGYIDFENACKEAYRQAFESSYQSAYAGAFDLASKAAYELAYAQAFKAHEKVRYQEGYDQGYAQAYAKWDAIGAGEAQKKGYTDGQTAGFSQHIATARAHEFAQGQLAEQEFFQTHPVMELLDASTKNVTPDRLSDDIVAGSILS